MDNIFVLILIGFAIGTIGTLIGAGGGFILVPILLLTQPQLTPEVVTAISLAVVATNAMSGTVAYARSGRVDYKAGIVFALFTIPGSILGVYTTQYIPLKTFHFIFGLILIALAIFLFFKKKGTVNSNAHSKPNPRLTQRTLTDKAGNVYTYVYNQRIGIAISIAVGYISPILGIGGGIIHVPAMVHWLSFPVHIATATSHFVLAIMSVVSVITNAIQGNYSDPAVQRMILGLAIGVIFGAQVGARLSHKISGNIIVRALAVCLAVVGVRILLLP